MKIAGLLAVIVPVASAGADTIAPGAGWVGTGLLGTVLGVIFLKTLPDKDKQLEKQMERKDEYIKELISRHFQDRDADRRTYEASLAKVTQHCKEELDAVVRGLQRTLAGAAGRAGHAGHLPEDGDGPHRGGS